MTLPLHNPNPPPLPEDAVKQNERLQYDIEMIRHVMSHDLLNPLRAIINTTDQLWQKYSMTLDETGRNLLFSVFGEAKKLQELHVAALEYMRASTVDTRKKVMDANALLEAAIEGMAETVARSGAKISHGGLPQISCRRLQMIKLFGILIDNAIKFAGERVPEIRIMAQRKGNFEEFVVEDDGIGVEEEYHEIIFVLFQRVPNGKHPNGKNGNGGNGVGLAIAKNIIANHGGEMWVESKPGKGSRFFFTLPAIIDKQEAP